MVVIEEDSEVVEVVEVVEGIEVVIEIEDL